MKRLLTSLFVLASMTIGFSAHAETHVDWQSDGKCYQFSDGNVAGVVPDIACRMSVGSEFKVLSDGNCWEFSVQGMMLKRAESNALCLAKDVLGGSLGEALGGFGF